LTPAILLWSFGSPGGLPSPHFGSVSVIFTFFQKWGCESTCCERKTRWTFRLEFCLGTLQSKSIIIWMVEKTCILVAKKVVRCKPRIIELEYPLNLTNCFKLQWNWASFEKAENFCPTIRQDLWLNIATNCVELQHYNKFVRFDSTCFFCLPFKIKKNSKVKSLMIFHFCISIIILTKQSKYLIGDPYLLDLSYTQIDFF
jgi:hypothetical protein